MPGDTPNDGSDPTAVELVSNIVPTSEAAHVETELPKSVDER